jgi:hypothetical protein
MKNQVVKSDRLKWQRPVDTLMIDWENNEQDNAQQSRDPAMRKHKRGTMNSIVKNAKCDFSIEIRQEYNRSTEVTVLPHSFDSN